MTRENTHNINTGSGGAEPSDKKLEGTLDRQEEMEAAVPQQRDKGFTLIELLIVIVILGILSTIVVLSVRGITDKGEENACAADLKTLEVAQEAAAAQGITLTYTTPTSAEDQLVTAKLLRSPSSKYNITGDTTITPVATECGAAPAPIAATGATAGSPGTLTPSGAALPANLAAMTGITANPTTAWIPGQSVVIGTGPVHWNGTAWATGVAP